MKKVKYSLPFVNNGKPFDMPNWTVVKHKKALEDLNKNCKDMSQEEKDEEFQYYVIYETLKEIDENVDFDAIKQMHPEDHILLFNAVYSAGRTGILFREGVKKPIRKKSTGKKN